MIDAETGGNNSYFFEADAGLFQQPADEIIETFFKYHKATERAPQPTGYELNSAIKKVKKQVVMATGSLLTGKGDIPFLLMISPEPLTNTA